MTSALSSSSSRTDSTSAREGDKAARAKGQERETRRTGRQLSFPGEVSASSWRLALFARMWAVAALFHLAANARDALTSSPQLAVASAVLGLGAGATLLAPYRALPLAIVCVFVPVTAWYEAPVVGNHWVLATLVSLAVLISTAAAARQGGTAARARTWELFAPTARLTLLLAYGFAAFAKLNVDFLDPAVSCAVHFHNELVRSWGLDGATVSGADPLGRAVTVGATLTEVMVALAVAAPRTRRLGLALAVGFHWLLAMDLSQHFWDFSSVLFALFVLFLDTAQVDRLRCWTARLPEASVRPSAVRALVVTLTAVVLLLSILPLPSKGDGLRVVLGHLGWASYGTVVMLFVVALVRTRGAPPRQGVALRPGTALLCVVPALALFNGLTPYLEVKTGFGWNMYSNLRTVGGQSNHLIVPATLDTTGMQQDPVRILGSSDPVLRRFAGTGYALTYRDFRWYAAAHPDATVTYERGGRVREAQRLGDVADGRGEPSELTRRLQPFRLIDVSGSERCRSSFDAGL